MIFKCRRVNKFPPPFFWHRKSIDHVIEPRRLGVVVDTRRFRLIRLKSPRWDFVQFFLKKNSFTWDGPIEIDFEWGPLQKRNRPGGSFERTNDFPRD